MRFIVIGFSVSYCDFLLLIFEYSPQHPSLRDLSSFSSRGATDQPSHPYKGNVTTVTHK
jgi:hypothetical protein